MKTVMEKIQLMYRGKKLKTETELNLGGYFLVHST